MNKEELKKEFEEQYRISSFASLEIERHPVMSLGVSHFNLLVEYTEWLENKCIEISLKNDMLAETIKIFKTTIEENKKNERIPF